MPIKADNIIPKNSATAVGAWCPLTAVGTGWVASGECDFLGGRGSEITGIGTVKVAFFVSC